MALKATPASAADERPLNVNKCLQLRQLVSWTYIYIFLCLCYTWRDVFNGWGRTSRGLRRSPRRACFVHSTSLWYSSCILYCPSSTIHSRHRLPVFIIWSFSFFLSPPVLSSLFLPLYHRDSWIKEKEEANSPFSLSGLSLAVGSCECFLCVSQIHWWSKCEKYRLAWPAVPPVTRVQCSFKSHPG